VAFFKGRVCNLLRGTAPAPRDRQISVYCFPRRALTLSPQLCMGTGTQPGARFPARSADALTEAVYGHFAPATYRNRPIYYYNMPYSRAMSPLCHHSSP